MAVLHLFWSVFCIIFCGETVNGFLSQDPCLFGNCFPWQQPNHNRSTILMCPNSCLEKEKNQQTHCCSCYAQPIWNCSPKWPYRRVEIEYVYRRGRGMAVYDPHDLGQNISKLVHTRGFLTQIPGNLCQIRDLVEVDLSWNKIMALENINCMERLDTLILRNNLVTYLSNSTLLGMTELRILDLSYNFLTVIEPNTISDPSLGMLHIIFKDNSLTSVDITNVVIDTPFCTADFSNNAIKELVNDIGWIVDTAKDYGDGGFVDLSHNDFMSFPNFENLGFSDLRELGKVFNFGFDFTNANFTCDCKMQPFLELSKDIIKKIWRSYFNVTCAGPPALKGQSIVNLVNQGRLDEFTCEIERQDRCPLGCLCFHQPSQNRLVVNCSNTSRTSLPKTLPSAPAGQLLDLDFGINHITQFKTAEYLNQTIAFNMNNNDLRFISDKSLRQSTDIQRLWFRNNSKIRNVPKSLETLHPCNVSFGVLYLKCHCQILWMGRWANSPKAALCPGNNNFFCITEDGQVLPSSVWTKKALGCPNEVNWAAIGIAIALAVSSLMLGCIAWLLYQYQYEIYLLIRRDNQKDTISGNSYFKYDVYISFNENNPQLYSWVRNKLEPWLNARGYSLCLPCRDFALGSPRSDAILEHLQMSKKFLFIVDDDFLADEDVSIWSLQEWRHAWHIFKAETLRNIAVVNYDQMRVKNIDQRQIKAFWRLGLVVDFSNRKGRIFEEIMERLKLEIFTREKDDKMAKGSPWVDVVSLMGPYITNIPRCSTPNQKFRPESLEYNPTYPRSPYPSQLRWVDTPKLTFNSTKFNPPRSVKIYPSEFIKVDVT